MNLSLSGSINERLRKLLRKLKIELIENLKGSRRSKLKFNLSNLRDGTMRFRI